VRDKGACCEATHRKSPRLRIGLESRKKGKEEKRKKKKRGGREVDDGNIHLAAK
jgi:hypothetical protein